MDWRRLIRPPHRRGKLISQDVYEWPHVALSRTKRGWRMELFYRPRRGGEQADVTIPLSLLSESEAISEATYRNAQLAKRWDRRLKAERARQLIQKAHDKETERPGTRHRAGPVNRCPECRRLAIKQ